MVPSMVTRRVSKVCLTARLNQYNCLIKNTECSGTTFLNRNIHIDRDNRNNNSHHHLLHSYCSKLDSYGKARTEYINNNRSHSYHVCSIVSNIVKNVQSTQQWLHIDSNVRDAIQNQQPVVALESTIIAHGMPYPQNFELFEQMNDILIKKGVTPALIAIKDGRCRVGLSLDEVLDLSNTQKPGEFQKCSTREISILLSKQTLSKNNKITQQNSIPRWGATTVASTMRIAHMAGISTFVTGGIGGVHRGCEQTMDISTDLIELSRTPVVVVSAGIKSILDIGKTLEVLETYGIPTIGYQANDFPAFFSSTSGYKAPIRMDTPEEIATAYHIAKDLDLNHGFLVAVANNNAAGEHVEQAIQQALDEAVQLGIHGPAVTPYILRRVSELSQGDSLRSNVLLALNNTNVGADIAIAISQQLKQTNQGHHLRIAYKSSYPETSMFEKAPNSSSIVVVGGSVVDIVAKPLRGTELTLYTSNPSVCYESDGGVGRNIVEVLCRLGSKPFFFSVVGDDSRGRALFHRIRAILPGAETTIEVVESTSNENRTATYIAILNETGDLHTASADMDILECIPIPPKDAIENADIIVMDGNPSLMTLRETAVYAHSLGVKVFLEPTSVAKARKVGDNLTIMSSLTYATPNLDELFAMAGTHEMEEMDVTIASGHITDIAVAVRRIAEFVLYKMSPIEAHLIITCGEKGVILASKTKNEHDKNMTISFEAFDSIKNLDVQNTTGAGDTLAGAVVYSIVQGKKIADAVKFGIEAASYSLQYSKAAISPLISQLRNST